MQHIYEEIEHSKYLKDLPEDWDEQGAAAIDEALYEVSIGFLLKYAEYLLTEKHIIIESPEINPTRNGSVDLSWSTDNARMLINIRRKGGEMIAYYYGDLRDDKDVVKGSVSANKITDSLAVWMENLRK
ncbi:MAG: hypothetical protein WED82_00870 [Balneolales bacterium]